MKRQFWSCHFYLHGKMGSKWASTYSNACQKIPDVIINVNNILFILVYHLVKTNHWERTVSICGTKKERYFFGPCSSRCTPSVLQVFFGCSSDVLRMFIRCSSDVHQMFFRCSSDVLQMFIRCSSDVHQMFFRCSSDVLQMFIRCSSDVHQMFFGCSSDVLRMFIRCSSDVL